MVEVTPDDVAAVAPEFASMASEDNEDGRTQMNTMIEYARTFVCEGKWGSKSKLGICFMTAHLLKDLGFNTGDTGFSSDTAGPVTSEKVGDLQVSYGQTQLGNNASVSDQLLLSSKYGKNFLMLRKSIPFTPLVL